MLFTDCLHIHWDKETYSEVDLTKIGAYAYAGHPSTDVLLGSYVIGNGRQTRRWLPGDDYPFAKWHDRLGDDVFIVAWNSQFERVMWNAVMVDRYDWPPLPIEAFVCASAWARSVAGAPAKLELAAQFFGQGAQKDMRGHQLMLKMCRPATDSQQLKFHLRYGENKLEDWEYLLIDEFGLTEATKRCHHSPENLSALHSYCDKDTLAERDITLILPEFEWPEIESFWESERINDHGLCVDTRFAKAAATYAEDEKQLLLEELREVTGDNDMTPRTFARFKEWALPRMSPEAIEITEYYDKGVKKNSFDANTRTNLLLAAEEDDTLLDPDVRDAIEILDEAGKSTISKYLSIAGRACTWVHDGRPRVHGSYMFAGAAQTGRKSSVGIQLHNLVRDVPSLAPALIEAFTSGSKSQVDKAVAEWANLKNEKIAPGSKKAIASIIHALGQLVRPTITGDPDDDFDLIWADWSSIEAVLLPWLSLEKSAEDTLARFRRGDDIYIPDAASILSKPEGQISKFERQCYGKVPRLSLGFLGGVGALSAMAKGYGVQFDEHEKPRIVNAWRKANPWAQAFGKAVDIASKLALMRPGVSYSAGRLNYVFEPDALDGLGALFCELPSERRLCYPEPRIDMIKNPWGLTECITARKGAWRPKKDAKDWPRNAIWRGLLIENATQACNADLLNLAEKRARKAGLTVCGDTHDEILAESAYPEEDAAKLKRIMETRPGWYGDDTLPIRVEVEFGYRYKVPFEKEG